MEKKHLSESDLDKAVGGIKPEDYGEQRMIAPGVINYEICEKCGACMFPRFKRFVDGTEVKLLHPDYVCSECENEHHWVQVLEG